MSGSSIVSSARRWLSERGSAEPVWIVSGSLEAGRALVRAEAAARGAVVGWHALGLDGAAERLSRAARVARGLERAGAVAVEAIARAAVVKSPLFRHLREHARRGALAVRVDHVLFPARPDADVALRQDVSASDAVVPPAGAAPPQATRRAGMERRRTD